VFDPVDNQYLCYRLIVRNGTGELRFDISGAASRFLPGPPLFSKTQQKMIGDEDSEVSQRDAPSGAGRFAGGYTSSANQMARYAQRRRELEGAR
jgi:hypothetical protein